MNLINPGISVSQIGDRFTLVFTVIEEFSEDEIRQGFEFEDWLTVWEWDLSDHDHLANFGAVRWTPQSVREHMEWTWPNIRGDDLDTESGGEEIRAQAFLRNVTTSSAAIHVNTPQLQISPG